MKKDRDVFQKMKKDIIQTIIIGGISIFLLVILCFFGLYDAKLCATLIFMVVITCVIYLGLCIEN